MSDREFWDTLPQRLKEHRKWQEDETDRRTWEAMADLTALMVGTQKANGCRPKRGKWGWEK